MSLLFYLSLTTLKSSEFSTYSEKLFYREAEKELLGRDEDEEMLEEGKEESGSSDTEYTDSEEDTGNHPKNKNKFFVSVLL